MKNISAMMNYRPGIKVVDATLRDGGLVNDFYFEDGFAKALYNANIKAGVDYMEFGYKASKDLFDVMDKLCEATFVEPSYSEIKEAGIKLTDEQMMFVFSYTQNGVKALDSFREESKNPELTTDEPAIPFPTK